VRHRTWQALGEVNLTLAAPRFSISEVCVQQQSANSTSSGKHREGRGVWVLTAYGISGLALFGVLFYYFSTYVTH